MADSSSLSRFLVVVTGNELTEDDDDDDEDEVNESVPDEDYLQNLLDRERDLNHILTHVDDSIKVARSEAIQWIINMRAFFRFGFRTAYLSVTYIDRFLSKGIIRNNEKHWTIRLLSVACLSLAVKMRRLKPPPLSAFPTDEYNFEISAIQRMEVLVLTSLDWRMHSITPFDFIQFFISCFYKESPTKHIMSLITQIIFATIKDMNAMGHCSSTIAMAATLLVLDQNLTRESLEVKLKTTWLAQLFDHDDVYTCYSRLLDLEPVKVSVSKADVAKSFENQSMGTKRKRLTFSESEKKPHR